MSSETMKWQPFETAPKDGTLILAYREDAGIMQAHFTSPFAAAGIDDHDEARFTFGGEDLTGDLPTHWMPLPRPPK